MSRFRNRLMGSQETVMPNYLCFTALESGTFTLTIGSYVTTTDLSYIEYSTDGGTTWTKTLNVSNTEVVVTTPSISTGGTVLWRGSGTRLSRQNSGYDERASIFSSTGRFNVSGILMSLIKTSPTVSTEMQYNYAFPRLFRNCTTVVDASEMILPPNTLNYCFDYLFYGCTGLVKAPDFPAEVVAANAYRYVFYNCTSLSVPPVMSVTSITGDWALREMFYGCTSLTEAPVLKTETLYSYCYYGLFKGARSMNYIKMLAVDASAASCLRDWVQNVQTTSGIFVKHIDATWSVTGNSGVPTNWTVIYYDPAVDKYYTDQTRATECDDHGNPIVATLDS